MLSDKDYELLDEVFQKLKQADNTCSDVVLDSEEVRVLVDEFDDFNHELIEINKIIDEFEKEVNCNEEDRKSTRLNSSHTQKSRMPSSA